MWWWWRHSWDLTAIHLSVKTLLLVSTHLVLLRLAVLSYMLGILMIVLISSLWVLSAPHATLWTLIILLSSPLGSIIELYWFSKDVMTLALRDALGGVLL